MGAQSGAAGGIALRPATAEDFSFLFRLHAATMKAYVEQTWGWDEGQQQARYHETFDPGDTRIITLDGRDVGMLAVEERPTDIFLALIEIDPGQQNHGIGSALIQGLIAEGTRKGKPVLLHVLRVNPAKGLYERLGFSVVEETPTHYYMNHPAGTRNTQWLMPIFPPNGPSWLTSCWPPNASSSAASRSSPA